jgi:hypothetical protein
MKIKGWYLAKSKTEAPLTPLLMTQACLFIILDNQSCNKKPTMQAGATILMSTA